MWIICIPKLLWLLSLLCSIFVLALKVPFSPFVDLRELFEMLRLVLGLDFLSPLTFRSGTTIPGDVVIGGFYGLMMLGFLKFWPWCLAHQSAAARRRFYLLCRKKDDYKSDSPFKVGIQSCVCLRPENRPSVFAFSWFVICWGRGVGRGNNVLCLRCLRLPSVETLHVTLDTLYYFVGHVYCTSLRTSSVLRCAHFMLRWTCLRYFGVHTTWHVGHVYCNSVYTLHVTLDASTVLRCTHFMARWTRLRFFGGHTSCCVGHVYALWRNAKPSKRNVFWGCSTCILLVPTA